MPRKRQGENTFGLHLGKIYKSGNSIYLIDEKQTIYPINMMMFAGKFFNPKEGDIEYPRVWEDQTKNNKSTTGKKDLKVGDIVLFSFIGGNAKFPVVFGSISQVKQFGEQYRSEFGDFLEMQEIRHLIKENALRKIELIEDEKGNYEKIVTGYDGLDGSGNPIEFGFVKFQVDRNGEIQLDIDEIAEKIGTGNITLNLKGNDGQTNGNFTLNFNGKLNLINTDDNKSPTGTKLIIDNTEGSERIDLEDKNGNKLNYTTSGIVMTDANNNKLTLKSAGIEFENKDGKKIIMSSSGSEINSGGPTEKMILGEKLDDYMTKVETMIQEVMTALQQALYIAPAIPAAASPLVVVPAAYIAAKAQADAQKALILSTKNKND